MGLGWCTWTNSPWSDRFIVRIWDYFGIEEFGDTCQLGSLVLFGLDW